MIFGGKKPEAPLPIDRVRAMARSGMAEKDIIRQLKAEGFSFGEIEKALMAVVKEGVVPAPEAVLTAQPQYAPRPAEIPAAPLPEVAPAYPAQQPASAFQQPAPAYPQPAPPEYAAYQAAPQGWPAEAAPAYGPPAYGPPPEEAAAPQAIMEELIESVTEEKFEKFSSEAKTLKEDIEKIKTELKGVAAQAAAKPPPEVPKDLSDKLDDIEGRVGGLEKAFRQFLPSLTENIENLGRMIRELKGETKGQGKE